MARYAIGDIQGCCDELKALLAEARFSADRDELWFVGDLVNRGPKSLETLRFVRALGANATVVLGNHDLHLLAVAFGSKRKQKDSDTLEAVLEAPDRDQLLEWLLGRPLAVFDEPRGEFLVHAGLVPEWTPRAAVKLAREVEAVLRDDPARCSTPCTATSPTSGMTPCAAWTGCASSSTHSRACGSAAATARWI